MIEFLLTVTGLLGLGFVAAWLCRDRSAATRHAIWGGVFVGIVVLPPAMLVTSGWQVRVPALAAMTGSAVHRIESMGVGHDVSGPAIPARDPWRHWRRAGGIVWLGGAAVGMLVVVRRLMRVAGFVRRSQRLPGSSTSTVGRFVRRRVVLRCVRDIDTPMTCGWWRPVVLVPVDFRGWCPDSRRSALAHELAHVERHDWIVQLGVRFVCIALWFHPLVWRAARRMEAEAEKACDDVALARGIRASDYAQHLLELAERQRGRRFVPVLAMVGNGLSVRVRAILNPAQRRRDAVTPSWPAIAAGVVAAYLGSFEFAPSSTGELLRAPASLEGFAAQWQWAIEQQPAREFLVGYAEPSPRRTLDLGGWRLPGCRRGVQLLSERVHGAGAGAELWANHGEREPGGAWSELPVAAEYERAVLHLVRVTDSEARVVAVKRLTLWLPFEHELPLLWLESGS